MPAVYLLLGTISQVGSRGVYSPPIRDASGHIGDLREPAQTSETVFPANVTRTFKCGSQCWLWFSYKALVRIKWLTAAGVICIHVFSTDRDLAIHMLVHHI